jgi:RNA polymerase sigma factor (sigma-70 family)
MIRVAIVEDDTPVRESLSVLVAGTGQFRHVGSYPNAEVALKELQQTKTDVVLMDIHLPKMSGIECVARLKQLQPAVQVLMLTAYGENDEIFQSLQNGASGYLLKKTSPAEILEAIVDVHSGGSPMSNSIARKVVQHFQKKPANNDTEKLTPREHEILELLAKGYHYKEIAGELSISVMTVRVHLRHIYEKLQVRSRTEAVVKFLGHAS